MIYLFEDRRDRFNQYFKDNVDDSLININAIFNCEYNEIQQYIKNYYKDAKLVILHSSYNFSDRKITSDLVQNEFNKIGVPVILFSGNNSSSVNELNGTINSEELYKKLAWFVKQNDETNISKLIFGEKYLLNNLLCFQKDVSDALFEFEDNQTLSNKIYTDLRIIAGNKLKIKELLQTKTEFIELIKSPNTTIESIKNYIQNIINNL